MRIRFFLFISLLILLGVSCKKELPVPELIENENDDYDNSAFQIDDVTKWTFETEYIAPAWPSGGTFSRSLREIYVDGELNFNSMTVHNSTEIDQATEKVYKVLKYSTLHQTWDAEEDMNTQPPSGENHYNGIRMYVRQDVVEQKVYTIGIPPWYYYCDSTTVDDNYEFLLYDFSLEVGDQVPYNFWTTEPEGNVVDDIFYEYHDGQKIKVFKIRNETTSEVYFYADNLGGVTNFIAYSPGVLLKKFENQNVLINY